MNNMQCQIQNHNRQKIIAVCMDKTCKSKCRLYCLLCSIQSHNTHQPKSVEIDSMNNFIQQERQKEIQFPESCRYGQEQIILGLERLIILLNNLLKIIMEKIEVIKSSNLHDYIKKAGNKQQSIEQWNQLLKGILEYVEVDNCQINLTKSKEGQLNVIEEMQIKNITHSGEILENMIEQLNLTFVKIGEFSFKENRKHDDIAIINGSTIKKTKQESRSMAFANEGFDPRNQSYAFAFKIQSQENRVMVGVGNDDSLKETSYEIENFENLGHGVYMVSAYTGKTYHHSDEKINNKKNVMDLQPQDIIQIKYDHITRVLEFLKNQSKQISSRCQLQI